MLRQPPSWRRGDYARGPWESEYPALWQGLGILFYAALGPTGLVVRDLSGRNVHGAITGATWAMGGDGLYSLSFSGTSQYLNMNRVVDFGTGPFTLCCRYNGTDASNFNGLIGGSADSSTGAMLELSAGKARGWINNNAASGARTVNDGAWHHLGMTRLGATGTLYADGYVDAATFGSASSVSNAQAIQIGGWGNATYYVAGLIDHAAVYDRILSPAEFQIYAWDHYAPLRKRRPVWAMQLGGAAWSQSLSDVLAVADARTVDAGKALADAVSVADARAADAARALTDALALSDARAADIAAMLAEALAISDARSAMAGLLLADVVAVSDARSADVGSALADTLSLSDGLAGALGIALALADALDLADARASDAGRSIAEALGLSDSRAADAARVLSDALGLMDARGAGAAHALADTLGLSDDVAGQIILAIALSETLSLSDALSRGAGKALADALALTDVRAAAVAMALAQALGLVDAVTPALVGVVTEILIAVQSAAGDAATTGASFDAATQSGGIFDTETGGMG